MSTLWIKVSDEVEIPGQLSENEQSRLAKAFDPSRLDSPWTKALARLGMSPPPGVTAIVRFVGGTPYFNGTALALASSHGTIYPLEENGQVEYRTRLGFFGLLRVTLAQWKLEKFLLDDVRLADPLEESITLGLAIQALMLRLPSKSEHEVAKWLASPEGCPPASRSTVTKILALQKRRNSLSRYWLELFEPGNKKEPDPSLPRLFWDEPPAPQSSPAAAPVTPSPGGLSWKGIPVCPGVVEGELLWMDSEADSSIPDNGGLSVLCFARARPETTEQFSKASGLLFGEGGALSHACSIAREQGIPCVSGLGRGFLAHVKAWKNAGVTVQVSLNGATGEVSCVPITR